MYSWQIVNNVSVRKSSLKSKKVSVKKKDFRNRKNLLRHPPKITDRPTEEIIHSQLEIKQGYFIENELNSFENNQR